MTATAPADASSPPADVRVASGVGLATIDDAGRTLDAWFPSPTLGAAGLEPSPRLDAAVAAGLLGVDVTAALGRDELRGVEVVAVAVVAQLDEAPVDALDAYLRLHLLSSRLVQPHGCDLTGLFGLLSNVVWTTAGPCPVEGFDAVRLRFRAVGRPLQVYGVDKFPRMVDYVVPAGVRIADADRVRLGAHLAEGTTVMHEGFVNFNAGTLGASMVEGRISAGVVVGDGSDIGGSASIMGTLSGGGKEVVRIGAGCLLGANSGTGISLGDGCVVEAGTYVTAGSRVALPDGSVVKARELSGQPGWLYRRNSESGRLEAVRRAGEWGQLNADLHAN